MKTKFTEPPVHVSEVLRDLDKNRPYHVLEIQVGYWGDGATGYRLSKRSFGQMLEPFWVRQDELVSMYRRFADREMTF